MASLPDRVKEIIDTPVFAHVATVGPGGHPHNTVMWVDRDGEFLSQVISVDTPYRAVELDQNYPNPFNPTTQIDYYLPATERVTLSVYDVRGKLVTMLVDGVVGYGSHTAEWDGTGPAPR